MVAQRVEIVRPGIWIPTELEYPQYNPKTSLGRFIKDCLYYLPVEMAAELINRVSRIVIIESSVRINIFRGLDGLPWHMRPDGRIEEEEYGIVSEKVITDAGVNFLVDAFQNTTELENFKYHSLGTDNTAEAAGQTGLITELTTEYTGNVRATGTTEEGASANIYKTVATNTLDGTPGASVKEHGVHSASSAGTLWDRSLIGPYTLNSGDGVQSDYRATFSSGG